MSARSRNLPRRSCLSTPSSSKRFLAHAPGFPADESVLDLENSVAPPEKDAARVNAVQAIRELAWDDRVLAVRVNGWDSEWTYCDVIDVVTGAGERLDVIVLPKVQSAGEIIALDLLLSQVERRLELPAGHVGIEALIETVQGLANVEEICKASPRIEAVVFGPADFSTSIEMPVVTGGVEIPAYPGDHFHHVFFKMLMAARTSGIQVIDGPYLKVKDPAGLCEFAQRTKILGYDGKWALNPDQVGLLNKIYSPGQVQFDKACEILDLCEAADAKGRNKPVLSGTTVIDEASRRAAGRLVLRGKRAGLTRSPF